MGMGAGDRDAAAGARRPRDVPAAPELRAAADDDLWAVARIEHASFSDPWSLRSFQAVLRDPRSFFVVATVRQGGAGGAATVVGYVVGWFAADEGEIANLAVAPEARRHHVGAALLDGAIRTARTRGVSSLYLEVRESNRAARALYASRGFQEIGRRRAYYRRPEEDARVLRLVLPEGRSEKAAEGMQWK